MIKFLPNFIQHRWQTWGILLIFLWSLLLTATSITNMVLLSNTTTFIEWPQLAVSYSLNVLFIIGFGASSYGFWYRLDWGRRLFIGMIAFWSISNILAILITREAHWSGEYLLNLLRFVMACMFPIIYLNFPHIKTYFLTKDGLNDR